MSLVPVVLKAVPDWAMCVVCELNQNLEMDPHQRTADGDGQNGGVMKCLVLPVNSGFFPLGGFHEKSRFAVAVGPGSQSTESAERPELLGPSLLYARKLHGFPLKLAKLRRLRYPMAKTV